MQFKEEPTYEEIDIEKDSLDFGQIDNYAFDLDREETCYRGKNPDKTKRNQKAKQQLLNPASCLCFLVIVQKNVILLIFIF